MRVPLVAGNWKLNGSLSENKELIAGVLESVPAEGVELIVCPPAVYLPQVVGLAAKGLKVGAQDAAEQLSGAYTGEISAAMLADIGVQYVILGHSERRSLFGDSDQRVSKKFQQALEQGLLPILCLGETLEERDAGQTEVVVARQLSAVIGGNESVDWSQVVIAYEPVWAIGTGKTATPEQAQEVHAFIRNQLNEQLGGVSEDIRILYGGSVKPDNAAELFAQKDIDGGLIGGASLKAADFVAIAKSV